MRQQTFKLREYVSLFRHQNISKTTSSSEADKKGDDWDDNVDTSQNFDGNQNSFQYSGVCAWARA